MTNIGQFRPVNDDHAIQSVKFVLAFKNLISPKTVKQVIASHAQWKNELPAVAMNEAVIEDGSVKATLPVANFGFLNPDGSANWSMEVGGNQLSVECILYSRWQRVWDTAQKFMLNVVSILASNQSELSPAVLELTVRDVFVTEAQEYNLINLFNQNTRYLSPLIFNTSTAWHCNIGWFDNENENESVILNHLNTDSAPKSDELGGWKISVTHLQQHRFSQNMKIDELSDVKKGIINKSMENLHSRNKSLLQQILINEIINKIALLGKSK